MKDGLTPEQATRLLLDLAWDALMDREAERLAAERAELADRALELDGGREC